MKVEAEVEGRDVVGTLRLELKLTVAMGVEPVLGGKEGEAEGAGQVGLPDEEDGE